MRTTDVSVPFRVKRDLSLVPFLLEEPPGEVAHAFGNTPRALQCPQRSSWPRHRGHGAVVSAACPSPRVPPRVPVHFPDPAFKAHVTCSHTHTPSHDCSFSSLHSGHFLFPSLPCAQGHVSSLLRALNMGPFAWGLFSCIHIYSQTQLSSVPKIPRLPPRYVVSLNVGTIKMHFIILTSVM